jgi:hypothetical protein
MVRHQTVDAEDFGLRTPKLGNWSRLVGLWTPLREGVVLWTVTDADLLCELASGGDGIISQWTER